MRSEHTIEQVLEGLVAQSKQLWGEEDADRQRQALRESAEQIVTLQTVTLPVDLEPKFF